MFKYSKFVLGFTFIVVSFVFALLSFTNLTGYTIADSLSNPTSSIIVVALFIIGVIILTTGREDSGELERTLDIEVYKAHVTKKNLVPDRDYFIVDKKSALGKQIMPLGEFRRAYHELSKDSELAELVRDEYLEPLLTLRQEGGVHAEVASAFLDILGVKEERVKHEPKRAYEIPREYREELKVAFRQYTGTIDKRQKEILNKLGVYVVHGKKHYLLKLKESGEMIKVIPSTPSDFRGGLNAVSQLVHAIEKVRNRKKS